MKAAKITYYTTTALMSVLMAFSTYSYLTKDQVIQAFVHLGFPNYFRLELAFAKLIGAVTLWVPVRWVQEWTYAGFAICFVSAIISHIAMEDATFHTVAPMVILALLLVSYCTGRSISRFRAQHP